MYEKIVKAHTRLFSDYCEKYQRRTEQGHTAYLLPFIQSFLREIKGKRILDLGCGPGRDLAYFKEQSYEAVGLDCSPGMIKLCQEKGLHTICADFLSIPFDNESFNGIWAYTSLTLVPEEIFKQVLEKIKPLLQPQGVLGLGMIEGRGEGWKIDEKYDRQARFIARYSQSQLADLLKRFFPSVKIDIVADPKNPQRHYLHCLCKIA